MLRKGCDYVNDYRFTCPACKGAGLFRVYAQPKYKGEVARIETTRCDLCYSGEVEEVPHRGR